LGDLFQEGGRALVRRRENSCKREEGELLLKGGRTLAIGRTLSRRRENSSKKEGELS
jgi:hypothetical protein